jgi:dTDP-4-amino-4,6-dideoxygalactose transaminase
MLIKSPKSLYNCVQPLQYLNSARAALHTILENIDFSSGKKLLLPAYIGITDREGSGVLDPVQQTATPYEFYSLDRNLSALKDELYKLIKSKKYKALLVIHYFGFCQNDMAKIIKLCIQYDVLLIEDCAHTMLSEISSGQLGKLGDFSIYSLHKFLATKEGGCLRVNNKNYEHLLHLLLPPHAHPNSKTLDMLARADMKAIGEKRKYNYLCLLELINDCPGINIMYPELPNGIVPHNLPIIVKNGQREILYFKLIDNKIPVIALYYRIIEQIKEEFYEDSIYISNNILNLPVHQDIQQKDLKIIAQKLKESLKV